MAYDIMTVAVKWPLAPVKDDSCLYCSLAQRRRHSWFCRVECEAEYVRLNRED